LAQERYDIHEVWARTAESVVIVITPAQAELILPPPLDARRAIAAFPVFPLLRKEQLACQIVSDAPEHFFQHLI